MRISPYLNKDFDSISQWIADERFEDTSFVAATDMGIIVGFFCFSVNLSTNEGMLKYVIIDYSLRNKGYGNEMINLAVKYAFEIAKVDAVQLNVFPENPNAKKCYQKAGVIERTLTENAFKFKDES